MIQALILFLPLIGALSAFMLRGRIQDRIVLLFPCLMILGSALLTIVFRSFLLRSAPVDFFGWAQDPEHGLSVSWSFYSDPVTLAMLFLVSVVSSMVHMYALGYMRDDPRRVSFVGLLSLFTFFMMILITAHHGVQLFVGWEGVGLASYLLIGFWYHKPQAARAAYKAFVVNRIADVGLLTALCLIYAHTQSLFFSDLFATVGSWSASEQVVVALCLLWGVMGKSAQLGLHIWLPDAMEGPTPVSALIHAATMVTAGIFMVVRLAPFFEYVPFVLETMVLLGGMTAVWGGLLACGQDDIKRMIAYSTCSQLGYMVLACGFSAYGPALFHLLTHGFFKAVLFLGAGSIIHAFSGEQQMRLMGGCWRRVPITYGLMVLGALNLLGLPGSAGHASKEAVLMAGWARLAEGSWVHHVGLIMGLCAVGLTGFYSMRLILRVFHGRCRAPKAIQAQIHESPVIMWVPIALLGAGSLILPTLWTGLLESVHALGTRDMEKYILWSTVEHPAWKGFIPLTFALLGACAASILHRHASQESSPRFVLFQKHAQKGFYIDALYATLIVRPFEWVSTFLARTVDFDIIHALGPGSTIQITQFLGAHIRQAQTGWIHHYGLVMMMGLALWLGYVGWILMRGI